MADLIKLFTVNVHKDVDKSLLATLHSGQLTQGEMVDKFEDELSERLDNPGILTVNSATSGLHLVYRLLNLKPGDEVITTPVTCAATNLPLMNFGVKIVWADVDPVTGLIDPESVSKKITVKTKAIVCVDWGGVPCDYDLLQEVAGSVPLVADAAHSIGALHENQPIGIQARFTVYSFQAIKHLTSGDGGAISFTTTDDYKRAKKLRWFGIDRSTKSEMRGLQDIEEWGYKFHMNDLNASIGLANLKGLSATLAKHRRNAAYYDKHISNLYGKPWVGYNVTPSYWFYNLVLPSEEKRDKFIKYMKTRDIQVGIVHGRNDKLTVFKDFAAKLPGVDHYHSRMVCIPCHAQLTKEDRERIVEAANRFATWS